MPDLDHLYPRLPAVIAHRGASHDAPENTLPAFRLAVRQGADAVELDAKLSSDGVVVVMHDATVDRTTDGTGAVADLSLRDLKTLDAGAWQGSGYAGSRVPTLAEVLEEIAAQVWVNVELTNYTTRRDGLEASVVALIRKMGVESRVLLSSFNPFSLRKVRRLAAGLPLGLLTMGETPFYLRRAWLAPVAPHQARHPNLRQVTERKLKALHRHGLRVNVWTVNEPHDLQRLWLLGVDGLITDRPALARDLLG